MSEQTQSPVAVELQKLDADIQRMQRKAAFLRQHQAVIEELSLKPFTAGALFLDFDHLSREKVVEILKRFGGRWNKKPSFSDPTKIDYEQPIENGLTLRLYQAEPPPSCKLVEEDVIVPAVPAQPERIEKRTRLVCVEVAPEPYPVPDAYSVPAAERSAQ